jgi:hypothetical protein
VSDIKIGDAVILTKSIYDDGEDHHAPGYIAYMDETVYVKQVHGTSLAVAHEGNTGAFIIRDGEYRKVN